MFINHIPITYIPNNSTYYSDPMLLYTYSSLLLTKMFFNFQNNYFFRQVLDMYLHFLVFYDV